MKKKITYKNNLQKYGMNEYQKIHDLVYELQAGSKDAGQELINSFRSMLNKYISLIVYGQYSIEDYSIRSFIKLFVEEEHERLKINSYFVNGHGQMIADKTVAKIVGIFSNNDKEDIQQEICAIFLSMCHKYKDTKPSFHNYVKRNFHYYVFRYLEKLSKDPVARGLYYQKKIFNIYNSDQQLPIEETICDKNAQKEIDEVLDYVELFYNLQLSIAIIEKDMTINIYDEEFLNNNWINGITCSNIFKDLTTFERRILVMWYMKDNTDSEIAEMFGLCRGTINKKRACAKSKLKKTVRLINYLSE